MNKNEQILIYQTEDGKVRIETHFEKESVWLNQAQIGELFQKSKATISEHIKNIFNDGELEEALVVRDFRTTTKHGAVKGLTQSKKFISSVQAAFSKEKQMLYDYFLPRIHE